MYIIMHNVNSTSDNSNSASQSDEQYTHTIGFWQQRILCAMTWKTQVAELGFAEPEMMNVLDS